MKILRLIIISALFIFTFIAFTGCEEEVEVQFYKVNRGGHSWPGGQQLPKFIVGLTTEEINASSLMWEFFQQYKLEN